MPEVTLTVSTLRKAKNNASLGGFPSVSDYVERLIERDESDERPPTFSTREEFEALILEGLDSPSKVMTKTDWKNLRDEILGELESKLL